jgi:glyoxylate carboligase
MRRQRRHIGVGHHVENDRPIGAQCFFPCRSNGFRLFDADPAEPEGVRIIGVREIWEICAFMACAHAKFTGELGVCLATSGPGAIHLLNGRYDAKMDHQPP